MPSHLAPELIDNHTNAVYSAPNGEVPTRAMPQATQYLRDEGVEIGVEQFALQGAIARNDDNNQGDSSYNTHYPPTAG